MARKIPGFKKAEMQRAGRAFLTDEEGVQAFLAAVEGRRGRGADRRRGARARRGPPRPLPGLTAHPRLPERPPDGGSAGAAAGRPRWITPPPSVARRVPARAGASRCKDFGCKRGVLVPDTTWLDGGGDRTTCATEPPVTRAWRSPSATRRGHGRGQLPGRLAPGARRPARCPRRRCYPPCRTLPLSLEDFYGGVHLPRAAAAGDRVHRSDSPTTAISGWVKSSKPADWIKDPLRSAWTVDPLALDGAASSSPATGRG